MLYICIYVENIILSEVIYNERDILWSTLCRIKNEQGNKEEEHPTHRYRTIRGSNRRRDLGGGNIWNYVKNYKVTLKINIEVYMNIYRIFYRI